MGRYRCVSRTGAPRRRAVPLCRVPCVVSRGSSLGSMPASIEGVAPPDSVDIQHLVPLSSFLLKCPLRVTHFNHSGGRASLAPLTRGGSHALPQLHAWREKDHLLGSTQQKCIDGMCSHIDGGGTVSATNSNNERRRLALGAVTASASIALLTFYSLPSNASNRSFSSRTSCEISTPAFFQSAVKTLRCLSFESGFEHSLSLRVLVCCPAM